MFPERLPRFVALTEDTTVFVGSAKGTVCRKGDSFVVERRAEVDEIRYLSVTDSSGASLLLPDVILEPIVVCPWHTETACAV